MSDQMDATRQDADDRALKTWVYDWLEHAPPKPDEITEGADRHETFEAVARAVFDAHEEILTVLRFLDVRADTPEVKDLIEQMVNLEEGHSRQMSQQMNRISDM
ncbi:MAG: hypothetical protein U5R48_10375 [Gammaproteobacteria bacterium]|nr:hypothetical protein [Gammaproteobacteria bacterium]